MLVYASGPKTAAVFLGFFADVRFQSATQWTTSIHTSHMPKPVM